MHTARKKAIVKLLVGVFYARLLIWNTKVYPSETIGQISHLRQSGVQIMHNLINLRFLSGFARAVEIVK